MRFFIASLLFLSLPVTAYSKALKCPSASVRAQYDPIIFDAAKKYKVAPALIFAVIRQESCFDKLAVSHAGAQGLMQLMPMTAQRFAVKNSFVPSQNINAGTKYLAWLLKRFNGNIRYALAGYNAGEGRVDRYNGIPPFKETRKYVKRVMAYYHQYSGHSKRTIPKTTRVTHVVKQSKKSKQSKQLKSQSITLQNRNKRIAQLNKIRQQQAQKERYTLLAQQRYKRQADAQKSQLKSQVAALSKSNRIHKHNVEPMRLVRSITLARAESVPMPGYTLLRARGAR